MVKYLKQKFGIFSFLSAHCSGVGDIHNIVPPSPLTRGRTFSSCQAETLCPLDLPPHSQPPHPHPYPARLLHFPRPLPVPGPSCVIEWMFVLLFLAYFSWHEVFRARHVEASVRTSLLLKAGCCSVVCAAFCLPVRLLTGIWLLSTIRLL